MGSRMENRLPDAFLRRMRMQLGDAYPAYLCAMEQTPLRALRVNTLKISEESFCDLVDFSISRMQIPVLLELSSVTASDFTNSTCDNQQTLENSCKLPYDIANSTHFIENSPSNLKYITNIHGLSSADIKKSSGYFAESTIVSDDKSRILEISNLIANDFANILHNCFSFPTDIAIGKHPLHAAGLVYVQEPSAQIPALWLDAKPGMTVLDLCAAPGGKTGQLAAAMQNTGLLIANEPVPARAETLVSNVERLGIRNCVVTSMYPDALCGKLSGMCDAVLVDAPCSGEGMFRRDPAAIAEWSPEHVQACALRQRGILAAADLALRPGGVLVYSTCTFSPEENEETVSAFLTAHRNYHLLAMQRFYPHTSPGEGQFMAKLVKDGTAEPVQSCNSSSHSGRRQTPLPRAKKPVPEWDAFAADTFRAPLAAEALPLPDGRVLLPPAGFDRLPAGLRILRAGVLLGESRQGRFIPAHALAMAMDGKCFQRCVPLTDASLTACLAGETVPCDPSFSGYCAATYAGHTLCFGKAVGGTLKNHLPKGLRIRSSS